jgi:DNA-binding MarR family transcriptional regulator
VGVSTTARRSAGTDQFLAAFDAFAQAVRRARGARAGDPERGLTLSQYGLLEPLADRADARVSELAEQAGIAPSTASRMLDALERRGIVARSRQARDRRGVTVALTRAGAELLSREHEWLRARQRGFFANLPADERALAPDLLVRLAALIDELAAGPN